MKKTNITERFYKINRKTLKEIIINRNSNNKTWTRKKATSWIQEHQYIGTDGDYRDIVIDGDGRDLYQVLDDFNSYDLSPEELGKLLVFVFNDYVEVVNKIKTI
jgi:hypothetical protein